MNNSIVSHAQSSSSSPNKAKRTLLMVLGVFVLPVLLAKLALVNHWFNYGVTNKGALVSGEITLAKMALADLNKTASGDKTWLLLYVMPASCSQHCQQFLHSINNTYVALGKEIERVKPVALSKQQLTAQQRLLLQHKNWQITPITAAAQQLFTTPQVLIVDTLGNVVLSYQPPTTAENFPQLGKAILADFKKLLKYSKIG